MASRYLVLSSIAVSGLLACGPVKGTPPGGDDDAPPATASFELAVLTSKPIVPLDGKATVDLGITRTNFDGELDISGVTTPNGLTIDALHVDAGATTAQLVVGATAPFAIGDKVTFSVEGVAAGVDNKMATITDAEVTGKPGSADASFGVGTGYASISFGSDDDGSFNALDVLGGKIITTGIGTAGLGPTRFSTMRFTADGVVDTTFNNGTLVRTVFNSGTTNETGFSAGIGHQIDGRPILIGAHQGKSPTLDLDLARLSTTGGSGGVDFGNINVAEALFDLSGGPDFINQGIVLADNRMVAVGDANGHHVIAVVQMGAAGLDGTFHTTGIFRDVIGQSSTARSVAVDANNRFVVAGQTSTANGTDLTLHRYTGIGLDSTFGTGGRVILTAPGTNEAAIKAAVLPGGKIIYAATSESNIVLLRFNADGTPDTAFGMNGTISVPSGGDAAKDFLVLPDGKFLLLGQNANDAVLIRFRPDGSLDPLFGANGRVTVPFGDSALVNAFIVYDAHKVVLCGGNLGGVPGPGTKGLLARVWM